MTSGLRVAGRGVGALALAGAATLAYGVGWERTAYTLRQRELRMLPPGADPIRVLHLTDLHMTPGQRGKQRWLQDLGRLVPDLVVLTGDVLSHPDAGKPVIDALGPLLDRPGAFVPGNNDYFAPVFKSPMRYVIGRDRARPRGAALDWDGFARDLVAAGRWIDATNVRTTLQVAGQPVDLRGVDDPYLGRDRLDRVAGRADPSATLRLALAHAPEPRVLDAFLADGIDLMLAGHTHGGQVRIPGYGALVTNCGIDRDRARGLSAWGSQGRSGWLHVSAGVGTGPYSPLRLACRPETTLLTLLPVR